MKINIKKQIYFLCILSGSTIRHWVEYATASKKTLINAYTDHAFVSLKHLYYNNDCNTYYFVTMAIAIYLCLIIFIIYIISYIIISLYNFKMCLYELSQSQIAQLKVL